MSEERIIITVAFQQNPHQAAVAAAPDKADIGSARKLAHTCGVGILQQPVLSEYGHFGGLWGRHRNSDVGEDAGYWNHDNAGPAAAFALRQSYQKVWRREMLSLKLVLMFLALIAFVLAAVGVATPRINLIALGLALWVLALIVT